MKKIILLAVFYLSSCAYSNAPSGNGLLYTEVKELNYYDPYIKPNKKSTLCAKNFFGLISHGDNSLDSLRYKSNIRKIASIEKTYSSRFSLISRSCTIITGE